MWTFLISIKWWCEIGRWGVSYLYGSVVKAYVSICCNREDLQINVETRLQWWRGPCTVELIATSKYNGNLNVSLFDDYLYINGCSSIFTILSVLKDWQWTNARHQFELHRHIDRRWLHACQSRWPKPFSTCRVWSLYLLIFRLPTCTCKKKLIDVLEGTHSTA